MPDTKITHLRNLMSPMVNFFSMYKHKDNPKVALMLEKEVEKINQNMPEILEILKEIPDDAIDGDFILKESLKHIKLFKNF